MGLDAREMEDFIHLAPDDKKVMVITHGGASGERIAQSTKLE